MEKWHSSLINDDIDYSWIYKEMRQKRFDPIEDFMNYSYRSFEEHLTNYLTDNLKRLGYKFYSMEQLINFCKERVHRVSFKDNPDEIRFYLDYISENEIGTYIGAYCNKTSVKYEGNTVTAIFGQEFN